VSDKEIRVGAAQQDHQKILILSKSRESYELIEQRWSDHIYGRVTDGSVRNLALYRLFDQLAGFESHQMFPRVTGMMLIFNPECVF
jgi:hypothetical protein